MNDLKKTLEKLSPALTKIAGHLHFIFIVVLLACCGYLVQQINSYANVTPDSSDIVTETQTIAKPRVDQAALEQLQKLEDQNIEVQSIFEEARNNPFTE